MEKLELTVRPTFDSLVDEDYIEGNDDALLYQQGLNSEPVSIDAEKEFLIPDGYEAQIESPVCFLEWDKERDDGFVPNMRIRGFLVYPEECETLVAGQYLYKGNGIIQRFNDFSKDGLGRRGTLIIRIRPRVLLSDDEKKAQSEDQVELWYDTFEEVVVNLASYFTVPEIYEAEIVYPICVLEEGSAAAPIENVGELSAGTYLYVREGTIQRIK